MTQQLQQVRKRQTVQTPYGAGSVTSIGVWQEGEVVTTEICYQVTLERAHPQVVGLVIDCDWRELRDCNPGVFFPQHRGEVLRQDSVRGER